MRAHGWRPGWDGHLLLIYDDEPQRRTAVAEWVRRGLGQQSKILVTQPPDDPPERSLSGLLVDDSEALEALERGQIQVVPADPSTYDPGFIASVVDDALAQGYPSVRWSGDASTAWDLIPRSRHELVEQATDELCVSRPLSVLCQYSTCQCSGPASEGSVDFLSRAHGAGLRGPRFQAAPVERGLAVAGELDATNHTILTSLLTAATAASSHDPFVVDLSLVDFLDLPGARALLFGTLEHRDRGGRVRLEAAQPHVAHLLHLLGIDKTDGIDVGEAL